MKEIEGYCLNHLQYCSTFNLFLLADSSWHSLQGYYHRKGHAVKLPSEVEHLLFPVSHPECLHPLKLPSLNVMKPCSVKLRGQKLQCTSR